MTMHMDTVNSVSWDLVRQSSSTVSVSAVLGMPERHLSIDGAGRSTIAAPVNRIRKRLECPRGHTKMHGECYALNSDPCSATTACFAGCRQMSVGNLGALTRYQAG